VSLHIKSWCCFLLFVVVGFVGVDGQEGSLRDKDASTSVGIIVSVRGQAIIQSSDGVESPAKLRSVVRIGDRLETGVGAYIQIDFLDGSKVSLAGSSDLTIDDYGYGDKEQEPTSEVSIENGALSFMAGKIKNVAPQNYKIKTAFATVGIRGSSGELQTSDGSLPGVPASLVIVKMGGEGIIVAATGAPPQEITETGRGFILEGQNGFKAVKFSGSVIANYSDKNEAKFSKGRKKAKALKWRQQQSQGSQSQQSPNMTAVASGGTSGTVGNQQDSQDDDSSLRKSSNQGRDFASNEQEELAFDGSMVDAPSISTSDGFETGDEGGFDFNIVDESDVLQVPLEMIVIEEAIAGEINVVAIKASEIVQQGTETHNEGLEQAIVVAVETSDNSTTMPSPTSGYGYGETLWGDGTNFDAIFSMVNASIDSYGNGVTAALGGMSQPFSWLGLSFNPSATTLLYKENLTSSLSSRFLYEGQGEFFIADEYRNDGSNAAFSCMYFGEYCSQLPASGIQFYDSYIPWGSTQTSSNTDWVTSSLLVYGGKILNPGFATHAFAHFGLRKVGAITTLPDIFYRICGDGCLVEDRGWGHGKGLLPFTLFYGELGNDGSVNNGRLFMNMGFLPSHVSLESTLGTSPVTYGLQMTSLGGFQGGGQLYGSSAQGLGLTMTDGTNDFVAAAFAESRNDRITINGTDGLYSGYGRGISLEGPSYTYLFDESFSNFSMESSFSTGSVTGSLTIYGHGTLNIGTKNFAIDREIVAGELIASDPGIFPVDAAASFMCTLDLPRWWASAATTPSVPQDVMWGIWNVLGGVDNMIAFPGHHNFWVAGVPTVAGAGTLVKEKLGISDDAVHYKGGLLRTFLDPSGSLFQNSTLFFGPGWTMNTFNGQRDSDNGIPVSSAGDVPVVFSDACRADFLVNFSDNSIKGIAYGEDDIILLFRGGSSSVNETGFWGDVTAVSLKHGSGTGIFNAAFSGVDVFRGRFAGNNAASMIFEFERLAYQGSGDERIYGVGLGAQQPGTVLAGLQTYNGYMHGVWRESPIGAPVLLSNPDLVMTYQGTPATGYLTGYVSISNGSYELDFMDANASTIFITKDAFFTTAQVDTIVSGGSTVSLATNAPLMTLDPNYTFFVALPDLERYQHVNWGQWSMRETSGSASVEGYFAGGRISGGASSMIPDIATLAAASNPIVHYHGDALASVYTGTDVSRYRGIAALDVNFNTAAVIGLLSFDNNATVGLSGTLNSIDASFQGTALLNNSVDSHGDFRGGLYENEGAGTFGTALGDTTMVGAFGVMAETALPVVNR